MNTEVMKNMVVIKDLPSNMIEEAFMILKPNLKVKELNTMKVEGKEAYNKNRKNENYIVKEAELLVSEYISKIEKKDSIRNDKLIEKKCKKLKKISIVSFVFAITCLIINIFF